MNCMAKRICSIVTVFVLLCTVIYIGAGSVYASDDNAVSLKPVITEDEAGSIKLTVEITRNAGFDSIQFEIEYDKKAVELKSCNNEWTTGTYENSENITDCPYVCTWRNKYGSRSDTGSFLTLTFSKNDAAAEGEYLFNIVDAHGSSSAVVDGKVVKSVRDMITGTAVYRIGSETDITGNLITYNARNDANIRLYPYNLDSAEIKSDILKAESGLAMAEAVKTADAVKSDKKYSQPYTLTAVEGGQYKLAVYKPGYGVHIEDITFGSSFGSDITLCLLGDLNGDGTVGLGDKVLFARYLAHWTGYDESIINKEAADITGDGNMKYNDAAILYRHLSKWKGYETLEYGMNL